MVSDLQWGIVPSQTYQGYKDYPVSLTINVSNTDYIVVVTRNIYKREIGSISATPVNTSTFNLGFSGYSSETINCKINWLAICP